MKTLTQKGIRTPIFSAALFTIVKIRKQPKCPSMMRNEPVYLVALSCFAFPYQYSAPHLLL